MRPVGRWATICFPSSQSSCYDSLLAMAKVKELSDYKKKQLEEEQKEFTCGIFHDSIEGWKVGNRKRFRVDFEPQFEAKSAEGLLGVHINEEDFTRQTRPKICHPTRSSLL